MKIFYPWTIKKPSDRFEKASHLCERCGFNLDGWREEKVEKKILKSLAKFFLKIESHPWIMIVSDDIKTLETFYELIPITYIISYLKFANSLTTHDFVDPFERGDFEDDVTRFSNDITRNELLLWIYPTTKYRKFFNYESRIFNNLSDRAASGAPTVFLVHFDSDVNADKEALPRIWDEIGNAVGKNIARLIKTQCDVFQTRQGRGQSDIELF
jgi:hypothetical protein